MKLEELIPKRGARVLVLGSGVSGVAAAELLLAEGFAVTVWDRAPAESLPAGGRLASRGAEFIPGGGEVGDPRRFSLAVLSPGIPPSHPLVHAAAAAGVPVIGELELGAFYCRRPLIAVTGTNGKTTTASLLGRIFAAGGVPAAVGGNIGVPLCRLALEGLTAGPVVAEVSSFQLETAVSFRPRTAVFLNFAPDHLDRYPGLQEYRRAKLRIFSRQGPGDRAILPPVAPGWLREAVPAGVKVLTWNEPGSRVLLEGGEIVSRSGGKRVPLLPVARVRLAGAHNLDNIMAAAVAALDWGLEEEAVAGAIGDFSPLAHRLEPVGSRDRVDYFNDSKATNPQAAAAALASFTRPVIWIAGGSDKGFDFSGLAAAVRGRVKLAVLIGETAGKIGKAVAGAAPVVDAPNLVRAVDLAREKAAPGDVVLLSPACASFDQFKDYRHRGEVFREAVLRIAEEARPPPGGRPAGRGRKH